MRRSSVLPALQGLRGAAALLVVLDHTHANFASITAAARPVQPWPFGALGVAVFFVISGFIMIYVHCDDFGRAGAPTAFFARRVARIFPFYALMTLVYVLRLGLTGRMPELTEVARSLFFIPYQNPHEPYGHPVLGQGWTLKYETLFYLVFGPALFFAAVSSS